MGLEIAPYLRQGGLLDEQAHHEGHGHEEHGESEDGVELADNLVDGQQGGDDVVGEDEAHPTYCGPAEVFEHEGGAIDEDDADHHEQEDGEDEHHALGGGAQVGAYELGEVGAIVAYGEHAGEIVVDGAGEDAAEDNPKVGYGTIPCSHDGSKDGACARNVEELNHEDFPGGHDDVVDTVGMSHGRGRTVVRREDTLHELAIEQVAYNKRDERECK